MPEEPLGQPPPDPARRPGDDGDLPGLEHDVTAMGEVAAPETLPTMVERQRAAGIESPFRFWDNMENRPLRWRDTWPPPGPLPPVAEGWFRFMPTATFADPLADASRLRPLPHDLSPEARGAWRFPPYLSIAVLEKVNKNKRAFPGLYVRRNV